MHEYINIGIGSHVFILLLSFFPHLILSTDASIAISTFVQTMHKSPCEREKERDG